MTTVREIFERMPGTFLPEKASGLNLVIQFDITGTAGGTWHAAITDGKLAVAEGAHPRPQVTLRASAEDYLLVSTGKLSGPLAFMTGRIQATGDLRMAMKMQSLFRQPGSGS